MELLFLLLSLSLSMSHPLLLLFSVWLFLKVNGVMENAITGFTKSSYKSLSLKLCCNCHDGQRRNVNPLDFRVKSDF